MQRLSELAFVVLGLGIDACCITRLKVIFLGSRSGFGSRRVVVVSDSDSTSKKGSKVCLGIDDNMRFRVETGASRPGRASTPAYIEAGGKRETEEPK